MPVQIAGPPVGESRGDARGVSADSSVLSCRDVGLVPVDAYEIEGSRHELSSLSNGRKAQGMTTSTSRPGGLATAKVRPEAQHHTSGITEDSAGPVLHEGTLLKRGLVFSGYQERFFKLYPDVLVYAKTCQPFLPIGKITFGQGLEVQSGGGNDGKADEARLFSFSIRDASHRSMYCACASAVVRDVWVRELQAACERSSEELHFSELLHEDESRAVDESAGGATSKRKHSEHGRAWFYPELPWGAPPSWQLLGSPQTKWLLPWEICTSCAVVYVGLKVPYTSFIDNVKEPGDQIFGGCNLNALGTWSDEQTELGWKVRAQSATAGIDLVCDIMFALDIAIAFLTARWIVDTEGREHWRLVEDRRTIKNMYMFSCPENKFTLVPQFWIDFLGAVPWQYADCVLSASIGQSLLKGIRVMKMIKLFRLMRLKRLIDHFRFKFPGAGVLLNASQLLLVLFFAAHVMGCIWFMIGLLAGEGGWIAGAGLAEFVPVSDGDGERQSAVFSYSGSEIISLRTREFEWVTALYWAITTV